MVVICLIGNDGAGKTTQAKALQKYFLAKKNPAKYIHFDHQLLRIPKFAEGKGMLSNKNEKNQSIKLFKPLKKIRLFSYVFPIILYIDFIVFYFLNIKFTDEIVILDRSIYDKIAKFVDLGVFAPKLAKPFVNSYPKPDYLFYLETSPQTSYKRKGELTKSLLAERSKTLGKVISDLKVIKIDANKKRSIVTNNILSNIKIDAK
jgi:thymidylate kinase